MRDTKYQDWFYLSANTKLTNIGPTISLPLLYASLIASETARSDSKIIFSFFCHDLFDQFFTLKWSPFQPTYVFRNKKSYRVHIWRVWRGLKLLSAWQKTAEHKVPREQELFGQLRGRFEQIWLKIHEFSVLNLLILYEYLGRNKIFLTRFIIILILDVNGILLTYQAP